MPVAASLREGRRDRYFPAMASNLTPPKPSRIATSWRFLRDHPLLAGCLLLGLVAGGVIGSMIPVDKPLGVRIVGGGLLGLFFGMCPLGSRLFD